MNTTRILTRFAVAKQANPRLIVDTAAIQRALDDYADVPGLEAHAIDCAEWLGAQSRRRFAAPTLRRWLRDKRVVTASDQHFESYIDFMCRRFPNVDRARLVTIIKREGPMQAKQLSERLRS